MPFGNAQQGGVSFGAPNIILVPTPTGPMPTPLVTVGNRMMAVGGPPKTFFGGTPAHNLTTIEPMTMGDPVPGGGQMSGTVMGPQRDLTASFTTLNGAAPTTRMTSAGIGNSTNTLTTDIAPSQLDVLVLAP